MEPHLSAINATTMIKVVICHAAVMYNHYLSQDTPLLLSSLLLICIKGVLDCAAFRSLRSRTFCLRESLRHERPVGMIVCDQGRTLRLTVSATSCQLIVYTGDHPSLSVYCVMGRIFVP